MTAVPANGSNGVKSAPKQAVTVTGWLRENLFSTWYNTVLTIVAVFIVYVVVSSIWTWGITNAVWEAETRRECFDIIKRLHPDNPIGACWAGVNSMCMGGP